MSSRLVFNVQDVTGFSPPRAEHTFVSRMLIDQESVGSKALIVNHFTLKAGKRAGGESHPDPYDEFYYVLRGDGIVRLGDPPEAWELKPGTVVFVPSGTVHSLENTGTEDLELITGMAQQPVEGVNAVYDARRRAWGTSFRLLS